MSDLEGEVSSLSNLFSSLDIGRELGIFSIVLLLKNSVLVVNVSATELMSTIYLERSRINHG